MDYSFAEQVYGPAVADKMREVDNAIQSINEKHKQFFADIPSWVSEEEGEKAKLQDFIIQDWKPESNIAGIGFRDGLPQHIMSECRDAFNKIIGE
jgi:hypothetical protein